MFELFLSSVTRSDHLKSTVRWTGKPLLAGPAQSWPRLASSDLGPRASGSIPGTLALQLCLEPVAPGMGHLGLDWPPGLPHETPKMKGICTPWFTRRMNPRRVSPTSGTWGIKLCYSLLPYFPGWAAQMASGPNCFRGRRAGVPNLQATCWYLLFRSVAALD